MNFRSNKFYQFVIIFTLSVYVYYLYYRVRYTINPDALIFSLVFLYAELHGFIALSLFFFQLWNPLKRSSPLPQDGLKVDVYITTYNEDIHLLRKTVRACINMHYLHETYILDDGCRPECKRLARELGCNYIERSERQGAKAGNINHALKLTSGDFIVCFDADYVPQPDFLEKTIGYFHDEKIAFVQVPQHYYNTDSFIFKVNYKRKEIWKEQDIFYQLMMPGLDYWNSAFFVGTGAVFRRKALEEIGGLATETITEDLHTSILLFKKKWKSVYHNEVLASGLAAKDYKNYNVQKLRWSEGNVSILFHDNPLFAKGLSLSQRISLFSVIFGWFIGFHMLIYFITPSILLLTGMYPIAHFDLAFLFLYVIFLFTIIAGFKIVSRGYGNIINYEQWCMLSVFVLIRGVFRAFFSKSRKFVVTGKGKGNGNEMSFSLIAPQLAIAAISFLAVNWGIMKLNSGVSIDFVGIGIASFWALVNGLLAFSAVKNVTSIKNRRITYRFIDNSPVEFAVFSKEDIPKRGVGMTLNINDGGISLLAFQDLPLNEPIELILQLENEKLWCSGTVLYCNQKIDQPGEGYIYGIRFEHLTPEDKDKINGYCFNNILPNFFQGFEKKETFIMKMVSRYYRRKHYKKAEKRQEVMYPAILSSKVPFSSFQQQDLRAFLHKLLEFNYQIVSGNQMPMKKVIYGTGDIITAIPVFPNPSSRGSAPYFYATTQDISNSGISFISREKFEEGSTTHFMVITPQGFVSGSGCIKRRDFHSSRGSFLYGVVFNAPLDSSLDKLTTSKIRVK